MVIATFLNVPLSADPPDAQISYVSQFGTPRYGGPAGTFSFTTGVEADSSGNLLISEGNNARVQRCNYEGDCEIVFQLQLDEWIRDIKSDTNDNILVAVDHRIYVYSSDGLPLSTFPVEAESPEERGNPLGLEIDSQGRIIVPNRYKNRIEFCDYQGQCTSFGSFNSGPSALPGQFWEPASVLADGKGTLFIGETGDEVISVCDETGQCVARLGGEGEGNGEFKTPISLGLTSRGDLVILEVHNHRIQLCDISDFNISGDCIVYGGEGKGDGQFRYPADIFIDEQDRIIVADEQNSRMQILQITYNSGPPGPGFELNPGLNGNWWKGPGRSGEGVQVEIANGGGGTLVLVATIYSYDTMENQIFLIAVGPASGNSAEVEVFITEGGMWGNNFDPADINETQWGTGIFTASSCDAMHMSLIPNAEYEALGFTDLEYDLIRLTAPIVSCPLGAPTLSKRK